MGWRGRPSQEWAEEARQDRWEKRVGDTSLLSDLQFPRHLTEGAGQTKGEGRPVVPDRALEGGRERLGSLRVPGGLSRLLSPRLTAPRAPGCDSARACRCAGSAGLQAGRARSSTRRSRRRCGRRGTEGRKCRTDLRRRRGGQSRAGWGAGEPTWCLLPAPPPGGPRLSPQ